MKKLPTSIARLNVGLNAPIKHALKKAAMTIASAVVLTAAALPAQAATYQDLWSIPSEPGWGVNIAQQGSTLFATWFVYGTDNRPVWYVMSEGRKAANGEVFTGIVYELRGSFLGVPWAGAQLLSPDTGTATFTFTDKKTLTLRYTINGVTVQKNIGRQTFAAMPINGTYYGGETGMPSPGCNLNPKYFVLQRYNISANFPAGSSSGPFTMQTIDTGDVVCNFAGTATQYGSLVEVSNGAYSCTNNSAGQFAAADGIFNEEGFMFKTVFTLSNACSVVGKISGARF
jgi:hypothetical protein